MAYHLKGLVAKGYELFVDIPEYKTPGNSHRHDIALEHGNNVHVIELTICFESNFENSRNYKKTRYEHLKLNLKDSKNMPGFFISSYPHLGFLRHL